MNAGFWRLCLLGLLSLCAFRPAMANSSWKTFASEKYHFSIHYPESWRLLSQSKVGLDIANFPASQKVEGVIIPSSGAIISVKVVLDKFMLTESLIRAYANNPILWWREMQGSEVTGTACKKLIHIESKLEMAPGAYQHLTAYYCFSNQRLFQFTLTDWEHNPNQRKLGSLAWELVRSLRITVRK